MNSSEIDLLVERLENLPTLPGVALKILAIVKDENACIDKLVDILSLDPSLSGKILRLINSALYALPTKVTSVSHAVRLLGVNAVKKVALGFSVQRLIKKETEEEFDYTAFWRDSVMAAIACRLLAREIMPSLAEDAFTLGLLHEIGRLSLNQSMPKQYTLVLKNHRDSHCDYNEAERRILGFTHAEVGYALMKKWGLPEYFYETSLVHHQPDRIESSPPPVNSLGQILFLASQVTEYFSGEKKGLSLGTMKSYLTRWGCDQAIQVDTLLDETHRHMKEVSDLFEVRLEEEDTYMALVEEARRELIQISDRFLQELLEQQKRIETLTEEIMRDGLTDLYNYKSFHCFLDREYCRAKRYKLPLTLVIGDVDNFKQINDTFGHQAGDDVLRLISRALKSSLRNSDIVARHGGEEFGILLTETPVADSLGVVERCRKIIESLSLNYEGKTIKVTMSFGISFFPPDSPLAQEAWIRQADHALYEAKHRGRNRMCVHGI